ncbi:MAG: NYN domain-containing protein [Phototrophicales bacterium]
MPYLIDGHNLIGKLPDIDLNDPNDEALLVQKLSGFVARTKQKCTVVFDSGLPGGESRMSTRGVKVIFAPHQSNADQIIMERIRKERNPKMLIVVSSDHEVLDQAKLRGMQTLKSAEFAALLQRPAPPVKPGVDEDANLKLTDAEIEEWLKIFGEE